MIKALIIDKEHEHPTRLVPTGTQDVYEALVRLYEVDEARGHAAGSVGETYDGTWTTITIMDID